MPAAGVWAAEKSPDQRYLDGLIARRLFVLAESYCQRRLQRDDLAARERTELVVDLSRVYAERALNAAPALRAEHWKQAHEVLEQAQQTVSEPSLRLLLRRQDALVHLARGRQLRQEAAVVAQPQPLLDEAKESLRQAVFGLDELARDVEKLLTERGRGALDEEELQALARDLQYQHAETLRNQALTYPPGDRDRHNALARAIEQFRPLAERPGSIDWQSLLGWVRSLRVSEQFDEAAALLAAAETRFSEQEIAAEVVAEFRLEAALLAIDQGRSAEAFRMLAPGPPAGAEQTAAWDYQLLVAMLDQWQQAAGTTEAENWQSKAAAQVQLIEERHSPYWRRRAESLLGSVVASSPLTDDLEVLVRAAQSFYRSGKIDDAVAAYRRAYQRAAASQGEDRAFEIGYTLAAIEQERNRHQAAAQEFRQLALNHAGHSRAPQAHLMAIYNAAQAMRGPSPPDASEYEALLAEHLGRWPRSSSTDQARIWLGRLHQQRGQWSRAVEAFTAVRPAGKLAAEAVDRAATCYRAWLAETNDPSEVRRIGSAAADYFEQVVLGQERAWPDRFSPLERGAAIQSARFRLRYAAADAERAEKLLAAAIARSPDADEAWKSTARVWLSYAIASQPGRAAEAAALLQTAAKADPHELLGLLNGLSEATEAAATQSRRELASLQLQVIGQLQPQAEMLAPAERSQLARIRAAALLLAGEVKAAREAYAKQANELPNDGEVQTRYAELLLASDRQADWQLALAKWREIEQRSQPASTRWYNAKLSQAIAYEKLGNCQQAVRIVKLTKVLHPNLGGPAMQAKFVSLLQRCGAD